MTDWFEICRRNARSVQTTIGWIFWDPGAVSRLGALGLPHPLGYIAARAAPLGPAGPEAITAAFSPEELATAWASLAARGLVDGDPTTGEVNADGIALRQRIEDDTDRLTTLGWELLGEERSRWFAEAFEPPCEQLLARVDITAGPNYQPASRLR